MDSFELNKMIGAFLGAVFVLFSVGIVSDAIFSTHAPETPGYAVAALEPETAEGGGGEEAGPEPIGPLLASADPAAGEAGFRRCAACHTVDQGGANRIGPNLWDIVNRPIAEHEGFAYSGAMEAFSEGGSVVWDYDHLSDFLLSPRGLISGTAMNFPGIRDAQARADMIAYLRTLSADPAPLPDPAAEPAAAEGEEQPAAEEGAEAPAEGEEQPAAEEPAAEEPAAEEPAAEEPTAGEGAAPAQPQQQGDAPAPADSAAPTPDAGTETADEPATDEPDTEAPPAEEPAETEEEPQQQQ